MAKIILRYNVRVKGKVKGSYAFKAYDFDSILEAQNDKDFIRRQLSKKMKQHCFAVWLEFAYE